MNSSISTCLPRRRLRKVNSCSPNSVAREFGGPRVDKSELVSWHCRGLAQYIQFMQCLEQR
jgi:hypothetical protein